MPSSDHNWIEMRLINIALITILLLVLDGLAEQVLARSWLTGSSQSVSISLKFRLQQADVMAELTSFNNRELLGKLLSIRGGSSPSLLSRMVNFLHKLLESVFGLRPKQHQKSNRKLKPAAIANKLHPNKAVGGNEIAKKKAFSGEKGRPSSSAVSSSSGTNRLRKVWFYGIHPCTLRPVIYCLFWSLFTHLPLYRRCKAFYKIPLVTAN